MDRLFVITILALGLTVPAFAKTKKTDAPPMYPLTGTVAFSSFNSDSSASMTVNGQTSNAYCSTESTNVSCTDIPGVFEATLTDGTLVLVGNPALQWSGNDAGNPVLESRHAAQPGRFSYRLVEHPYAGSMTQFFCVPNSKGTTEACYPIDKEYDAQRKKDREWCAAPLTDEEKQKGYTEKPEWCKKFTQSAQTH